MEKKRIRERSDLLAYALPRIKSSRQINILEENITYAIYEIPEGATNAQRDDRIDFPWDAQWGFYDSGGNIYVSEDCYRQNPLFSDLIALHEKKEWEYLNRDIPREYAHFLAWRDEISSAKKMGILNDYIKWRPSENFRFLRERLTSHE